MKNRRIVSVGRTPGVLPVLGLALACSGCVGDMRTYRVERKYPGPAEAPQIAQVAVAGNIVGRVAPDDTGSRLGHSVVVADFDGDGNPDIAAGMPGVDGGRGAVALIYGHPGGMDLNNPNLSTRTRITEGAAVGFGNERASDQFGFALAAGDFDADTLADLAVGIPYRSVGGNAGAGEVVVFYGNRSKGAAGLVVRKQTLTEAGAATVESGDHFGFSLAAGDFDGDGFEDLAIGAPDENIEASNATNAGAVFIRYGGPDGLRSAGYHYITSALRRVLFGTNTPQANERFGYSLAAGQLHINPNRHTDDLVVGAPGKNLAFDSVTAGGKLIYPGAGKVYVYSGRETDEFIYKQDIIPNVAPIGVRGFGHALALGDFDGNGLPDLAVGAPEAGNTNDNSGGFVYVATADDAGILGSLAFPEDRTLAYLYNADHHFTTGERFLSQIPIGYREDGDQHGYALAAADFNRDGYADLAVGAPGEDWDGANNTGVVYLYMGGSTGLRRSIGNQYFLDQRNVGATESGDRFGFALAAGNVDGDLGGFPDLVIGAPLEDNGGEDAGAVFLARTTNRPSGPFQGRWSGTVRGDHGTTGTLTMNLIDRDSMVGGTASLEAIAKSACGISGNLGGRATVVASKASANSTHAEGNLTDMVVLDVVNRISLSMDVADDVISGTIRVSIDGCDDVSQRIADIAREED